MRSDFTSLRAAGHGTSGFLTKALDGLSAQSLLQDLTRPASSPPCRSLSHPLFLGQLLLFQSYPPSSLDSLIPDIQLPPFPKHQPLAASSSAGSPATSASTDRMLQPSLRASGKPRHFPAFIALPMGPSRESSDVSHLRLHVVFRRVSWLFSVIISSQ